VGRISKLFAFNIEKLLVKPDILMIRCNQETPTRRQPEISKYLPAMVQQVYDVNGLEKIR
jgi:hypothetical protein